MKLRGFYCCFLLFFIPGLLVTQEARDIPAEWLNIANFLEQQQGNFEKELQTKFETRITALRANPKIDQKRFLKTEQEVKKAYQELVARRKTESKDIANHTLRKLVDYLKEQPPIAQKIYTLELCVEIRRELYFHHREYRKRQQGLWISWNSHMLDLEGYNYQHIKQQEELDKKEPNENILYRLSDFHSILFYLDAIWHADDRGTKRKELWEHWQKEIVRFEQTKKQLQEKSDQAFDKISQNIRKQEPDRFRQEQLIAIEMRKRMEKRAYLEKKLAESEGYFHYDLKRLFYEYYSQSEKIKEQAATENKEVSSVEVNKLRKEVEAKILRKYISVWESNKKLCLEYYYQEAITK